MVIRTVLTCEYMVVIVVAPGCAAEARESNVGATTVGEDVVVTADEVVAATAAGTPLV